MLKLFRHIRKKLIEQDKIRTYFWYAIGEVLLVVIGILLALEINNWNEQRIELLPGDCRVVSAIQRFLPACRSHASFGTGRLAKTAVVLIMKVNNAKPILFKIS